LLLAAALAAALLGRCASGPNEPEVRVTHDRSAVRSCVGLSRVTTESEGEAAEKDLKRQTAELGGNVLLLVTERSGDAYYCANAPQPEVTIPGATPAGYPTPLRPS
jgi:hypothetical protein